MKIGVTAPGSSTHFMVLHMMAQAGLKADDAAFIGVGAGPTAVAAAKRGEIDALVSVDPVINLLESENAIRDRRRHPDHGRHPRGLRRPLSGGRALSVRRPTPRATPKTVQSLANAFVRGLKWIAEPSGRGDRQGDAARNMRSATWSYYVRSIRSSMPMYSPDGRFSRESAGDRA